MAKRKRLGKGLEALLGVEPGADAGADAEGLRELAPDRIRVGRFQPRRRIPPETLKELADSIRGHGVVQPIVVRPLDGNAYELIAGERRWRAAQQAGLKRIPALVRPLSDREASLIGLIENLRREDLNPLETARGIERLIREFKMSHAQVATQLGSSRPAVSNLLRLLTLAPEVRQRVEDGELQMGHARALLSLPAAAQRRTAAAVARKGLSVRETEELARRATAGEGKDAAGGGKRGRGRAAASPDPNIRKLETRLSERLAAPVAIRHGRRGGGGVVQIRYASLEELDGILQKIGQGK